MSRVTVDTSELRALAADLRGAPAELAPKVNAVIFKGATKIKASMREQLYAANYKHYGAAARATDFDMIDGDNSVAAEIGPKTGPGETGGAAGIAYGTGVFGGARGGGSVRDPIVDLEEEAPHVEKALADLLGDIF